MGETNKKFKKEFKAVAKAQKILESAGVDNYMIFTDHRCETYLNKKNGNLFRNKVVGMLSEI